MLRNSFSLMYEMRSIGLFAEYFLQVLMLSSFPPYSADAPFLPLRARISNLGFSIMFILAFALPSVEGVSDVWGFGIFFERIVMELIDVVRWILALQKVLDQVEIEVCAQNVW